ncbi:TetR/AcrR family transcriptional regulator [Streptomyces sp. NA04227]|uniref:TetR/AcrR family transcriptional regulator n=1 Tax=Streptomyces sp. NA04227 TaxID=2742136 RepID=UPI0015908357|nr:TetR/AcrR family transcriptional regulator [Streptomyces sp. NA04227]QKW10309.1 TetR/AcrR family transcriptional regulator [Streptomyces sp. NA04227]
MKQQRATPRASQDTRLSTAARPSDDQILDTACAVFAESGFRGASMVAIAARAKSTKPTLYAHFGNKQQLYRTCLQREADKLTQWLFAGYQRSADLPIREEVRTDMRAFFDYAATRPHGFRLLFDDHSSVDSAQAREAVQQKIIHRMAQRIQTVLSGNPAAKPEASAELLAAMVVGLAIHGARHAQLVHPLDPVKAGELASSFAYAGLRHLDSELMTDLNEAASG